MCPGQNLPSANADQKVPPQAGSTIDGSDRKALASIEESIDELMKDLDYDISPSDTRQQNANGTLEPADKEEERQQLVKQLQGMEIALSMTPPSAILIRSIMEASLGTLKRAVADCRPVHQRLEAARLAGERVADRLELANQLQMNFSNKISQLEEKSLAMQNDIQLLDAQLPRPPC